MKGGTFGVALLFWFVAGMSTQVAVSHTVDRWRATKRLTYYDALCAARGGTAVPTDGVVRCLTCDGS